MNSIPGATKIMREVRAYPYLGLPQAIACGNTYFRAAMFKPVQQLARQARTGGRARIGGRIGNCGSPLAPTGEDCQFLERAALSGACWGIPVRHRNLCKAGSTSTSCRAFMGTRSSGGTAPKSPRAAE